MSIEWTEAPESVICTAKRLIETHHPRLFSVDILFVCRSEPAVKGGNKVYAGTSLFPAKLKALYHYDFLIWVSGDDWARMTSAMQDALIDHELCHCGVDMLEEKVYLRPHSIEEFSEVIERHGFWSLPLKEAYGNFASAVQKILPGLDSVEISANKGRVATLTGDQLKGLAQEVKA